jgi:D-glucuronyl C5-epimerase-like protein
MRGLTGLFVAIAALLVVTGAVGATRPVPGERAALAAVRQAVKAGRLTPAAARADRAEIARAAHLVRALPSGRRERVQVALEEVGAVGTGLTSPRALALFGQLRANDDYFAQHGPPQGGTGTDITDADGIVYRYFAGRCFEFHPLANFSALNARIAQRDAAGTERLADALAARGVPRASGGSVWEYYFPFGGRSPWVSGMAQAVAAQAFARAASLVTDQSTGFMQEATRAFRAVPRLTTKVSAGPWIRLYSFSKNPVLNAQLQTVLSLETYANATSDTAASTLAARMKQAAAATVGRFDTGYWTNYSLAGNPSPLSYQKFVVQLLQKLAPDDPRFARAAGRFAGYLKQPPAFKLADAPVGAVRFWLSKPASVNASTTAGRSMRLRLDGGWHTLHFGEPKHAGFYAVTVTAVDLAGNRTSFSALPLVRVPGSSHSSSKARSVSGAGAAPETSSFAVGAGIDDPAQAALAGSLGLRLVRMIAPWQPGQTAPDSTLVSSLEALPAGAGLVLELSAAELPPDDASRDALAQFAASLARQTPSLRDLVFTPAPTAATASAYADALAAIRAAVVAVRTDVGVGPSFDGSTAQPQRTALLLGQRLAHDGARADLVLFHPAPAPASGVWATGDVGRLEASLGKALKTSLPVLLDAVATPTTVPQSELGAYTGGAPPGAGAVSPVTQASTYAAAIGEASCSAEVSGVLLDRLVDVGAAAEPATGLYYASGHAKPSAAAVKKAIPSVARGAVVCPGVRARVTATTLTFPDQLSRTVPASIVLGCNRDCLYLATLDRADGRPVVARRGSLNGGDPAKTITLPKATLRTGGYRLDVRLVSRVGPSAVTGRKSTLLTPG